MPRLIDTYFGFFPGDVLCVVPLLYAGAKLTGIIGGATEEDEEFISAVSTRPFNASLEDEEEEALSRKNAAVQFIPDKSIKEHLLGHQIGRVTWKAVEAREAVNDQIAPFDREVNANSSDMPYRGFCKNAEVQTVAKKITSDLKKTKNASISRKAVLSATAGSVFYSQLQTVQDDNGFWPGDYGGPMFLLPGLVISCYVTRIDIGAARKKEMLKYIINHQQGDGGWGMHIEGKSTMFGSALNYVAARLLGLPPTCKVAAKARLFIQSHGGAVYTPPWGKFWLAVLGVYEYEGLNSIPPELFLLPSWFPFHPVRLWCHCRMVYLPMSTLYGLRFRYDAAESDPLIKSIRSEIYCERYGDIAWGSVRENISALDVFSPQSWLLTFGHNLLHYTLENPWVRKLFYFPLHFLRKRAIKFMLKYCDAEDDHTNFIDIGPVNKSMNLLCAYYQHGPKSQRFKHHVERVKDYLWVAEDGMKMQGYNGSQLWDTAFAVNSYGHVVKALDAHDGAAMYPKASQILAGTLQRTYRFLDKTQVKEDVKERHTYFRAISNGGWPFSTADHGWPISDCTSEGVKAVCLIQELSILNSEEAKVIDERRLTLAVEVIMSMHNSHNKKGDRGWASYEINRGYTWYEMLNPAQVFGDIMIDYCYVECTSACIQAILVFAKKFPDNPVTQKALLAVLDGIEFIVGQQNRDGSWYGSWGVCFFYAHWFATAALSEFVRSVEAFRPVASRQTTLRIKGLTGDAIQSLDQASKFLLMTQRHDGGWGESVDACATKMLTPYEHGTQVVQTAWSLLSLVQLKRAESAVPLVKRPIRQSMCQAAEYLISQQTETGDWPQQGILGVFNKTCGITYTAYRNVFPIWALADFALVEEEK